MMGKKTLFLAFISSLILFGCDDSTSPPDETPGLTLLATYNIDVPEPSGLTIDRGGEFLWTVSDQYRRVYKISLTGEIIDFFSTSLDDLEGITQNSADGTLYYVSEAHRKIVHVDTLGNEIDSLFLESLQHGNRNSGPEGIAYKPGTEQFCVVNEESPRILLYVRSTGEVDSTLRLSFASDFSGICFANESEFWMVSDRSKSLSRVDASGKELYSFDLPYTGMEGVAYDSLTKTIYMINDPREVLYVYKIKE